MDELRELQIAALLHDIGKFWQRTEKSHDDKYKGYTANDYGATGAHGKWSASFVTQIGLSSLVENLVLFHHKPESLDGRARFLASILQKSDHYSSAERIEREEAVGEVRKEPLVSVFSNLNLRNKREMHEYYYPLRKLGMKTLPFPVKSKEEALEGWHLQHRYWELWKEFSEEARKISNQTAMSFFETMFYLLKKYTSLMPAAAYMTYPDIDLFNHLKTTAAIACCLYQYLIEKNEFTVNDEAKYFCLISGDISGIQNFIYNVASPQLAQKGMAKRLRGRSFYLNLLNENMARVIVERLELTEANILWSGGGKFLILASNTDKTERTLKEYEKEINTFLFKKYGGKLFLAMVTRPASGVDLENFATLKEEIDYENSRRKRQKFCDQLNAVFEEEEFAPSDICPICGSPTPKNQGICEECNQHEELGSKITKAKFVVRAASQGSIVKSNFDLCEFNIGYKFIESKEELLREIDGLAETSSKIQIFTLNDTNFIDEEVTGKIKQKKTPISLGFSFLGNTVPLHHHFGILSFDQMAKVSIGSEKLGVLRMDVDDLGKLFAVGLGKMSSISRVSTMSSCLDLFFLGYLNKLSEEYYILPKVCSDCEKKVEPIKVVFAEKTEVSEEVSDTVYREKEIAGKIERVCGRCAEKKIPLIYINYSGGDDMLIVGPWDVIVKFARDARQKFKEYTCNNPDVNISAGIYICNPKFPIGRAALIAGETLKRSKILDKDRISVFTETVKWDSTDLAKGYNELLQFAEELEELINTKKISKGFVYSLLLLLQDTFGDLEELEEKARLKVRLERSKYVPLLKYKLARVVKDEKVRRDLNKILITEKMLPWVQIPASIVSLKGR